ncbi:hypothetical protein O6H91_03G045600 [Diphasiastrum complanatum]|uniref:Uncharacterized protein n=1 Tax=Diphasiastrum complanatum TaxID=34168 RepID=A0ACC2E5U1_DIPCM|nr:hypothetical protein O6H91_03G045600 [Diphasiastrum complanatum]
MQFSTRQAIRIGTCALVYLILLGSCHEGSSSGFLSGISISNRSLNRINDSVSHVGAGFRSRRLLANTCTYKDISISQSREGFSGIPQYIVQIVNTCMSDCAPSDIHIYCGWFASAPLVNPNIFRRVGYNDCLVNGGKPLRHGDIVRFEYSNSFMYPLKFKSASFC